MKLVNEKIIDWDEHLFTILFRTTYKVATGYKPYFYGLHPLMPIEYVMSIINGNHRDVEPTKVLIARIT
jgi:hypothetical protein